MRSSGRISASTAVPEGLSGCPPPRYNSLYGRFLSVPDQQRGWQEVRAIFQHSAAATPSEPSSTRPGHGIWWSISSAFSSERS